MPVLSGNTSGSIIGIPYNIPCEVVSYSLTNQTGGAITATLSIIEYGTNNIIDWKYYSLAANASESSDIKFKLLNGFTVYLVVSGSCDYVFNIE